MKSNTVHLITAGLLLALSVFACQFSGSTSPSEPKLTVSPITIGNNLTAIDLCHAIPQEDIEAVMGRKLVSAPQPVDFDGSGTSSGCSYDAGKDSQGNAYFGYVAITPIDTYNNQPLYKNTAVSGIGQEGYFNNGADARQLWIKINDQAAFVVAFGDAPNEEGAKAIARLLVTAIK